MHVLWLPKIMFAHDLGIAYVRFSVLYLLQEFLAMGPPVPNELSRI